MKIVFVLARFRFDSFQNQVAIALVEGAILVAWDLKSALKLKINVNYSNFSLNSATSTKIHAKTSSPATVA